MTKELGTRIADGLKGASKDDLAKFLEWVREGWKDHADGARRSVTYAILLMGVFELLSTAAIDKITLGPFALTNSPIIRVALPPIIAYLALDAVFLTTQAQRQADAYTSIFNLWNSRAEQEDLDQLMKPREPAFWSMTGNMRASNRTRSQLLETNLASILSVGLAIAFLGFEVQAYYVLFRAARLHRGVVIISLLPTLALIGAATVTTLISE